MIRMIATTGAALFVFATAATAADLPSKATEPALEAPPTIPVFSWTGFYVGMQAGYGVGQDRAVRSLPSAGPTFFGYNPHGVIGGAHAGYNYALPSIAGKTALVIGVEGDIDGADSQHTASPFGGLTAGDTVATRSDIKGSIRARFGFGVNRALFYATGGAAFADFNTRYNSTPTFGSGAFDAIDRTRTGYTVGGGLEYAFMNYLSVRAEYRYSDYGTFVDTLGVAAPGLNASVTHRESDSRVEAGISYKFDSIIPAPVAPRY